MKKKIFLILVIIISIVIVKADVAVEGLVTVGGNTRIIEVGGGMQMSPVIFYPSNATDKNLIWDSSDKSVAIVDQNGYVTGLKYGESIISVRSVSNPEAVASFKLIVSKKVTFDSNGGKMVCANVTAGANTPLISTDDGKAFIFVNNDDTISTYFFDELPEFSTGCEVSKNGYIFNGWEDESGKSYSASMKFENISTNTLKAKWVEDSVKITFEDEITCKPGETVKHLMIKVSGTDTFNYESKNTSVATVEASKDLQTNCVDCRLVDVNCIDSGNTQIVITAGDTKFRSDVIVSKIGALGTYMSTIRIGVGDKTVLPLIVDPISEKYNVRWQSSNSKVAIVDKDRDFAVASGDIGVVEGISVGKVKMTAYSMDNSNVKLSINLEVLNKKNIDPNGGKFDCHIASSNAETPVIRFENGNAIVLGDNKEKLSDFFGNNSKYNCNVTKDGFEFNGWYAEDGNGQIKHYDNSTNFEDIKEDKLYFDWKKLTSDELTVADISIEKGLENKATIKVNNYFNNQKYVLYKSTNNKKWTKVKEFTDNIEVSLTFGKKTYFRVQTILGKDKKNSNKVSLTVYPNKVQNIKFVSAGMKSIKISYDKAGYTGYEVSRSENNKKWKKVKTITKNKTVTFNNTGLKSNKTYYYKVRAYKKVNGKKVYGPWSDVLTAKTAPAQPKTTVINVEFKKFNITGSAKGAVSYQVYRSTKKNKGFKLVGTYETGGYIDTDLLSGKTYYYKTKACNENGSCSGLSKGAVSKKVVLPRPTITTLKSDTEKKVSMEVALSKDAQGYVVERSTKSSKKGFKVVKTIENNTDTVIEDETETKKKYYYRIRSFVVEDGKNKYSNYSIVKSITSK